MNEVLLAAAEEHGLIAIDELPERIQSKILVNPVTGCWEWTRSKTAKGYGLVWWRGRMRLAHRIVYTILVRPIPEGLELDHVRARGCIYRHCCFPPHLEPVTSRENTMRADGITAICARKTHCDSGHEFTPENTHITRKGERACRACRRSRDKERHAAGLISPDQWTGHKTTHCHNGHERTPESTYVRPDGRKECRVCKHDLRVGKSAA